MFPDVKKTRVVFSSSAEEQFYNACQNQLSDGWRVYYSVTLSQCETGGGLRDNEADFVLYHPRHGVVVVEVKGGRIRYEADTESYYSINRHDEEFKIKNPFQQALVWKSRFVRLIRQKLIKVPVSYAVALPHVYEHEVPVHAALEPEVVIGKDRLADLGNSLQKLVRKSHPERFLQFSDVSDSIDKLLRGADFATKMYFRDYIDGHESQLKDTETVHETFVTPIAGARRLGIEGEAGTGKTMLAILLAKQFRDQGKRVLILTSNHLLNLFVQSELGQDVAVETYVGLAESFGVNLLAAPENYQGSTDDWIQYDAPDCLGLAIDQAKLRYDVLICDESQDVQPFWWEQLEKLIADSDDNRFYIFFDRSQGVFGSGGGASFVPEQVLPVDAPYFPLVHNYRTTMEIARFSRFFKSSKDTFISHTGRLGYVPELILYEDAADAQNQLEQLVGRLCREEGLRPDECAVLSARKPEAPESILKGVSSLAGYSLLDLARYKKSRIRPSQDGKVILSTIAGFKGLETPVGILTNISEYNLPLDHPIMASLLYVAATRAKHMLYVMVQKDDEKRGIIENAIASIGSCGGLVIDKASSSDYEFVGTVVHYNPERMGLIAVEDGAFQRSKILFFPHDVMRAAIAGLAVGVRVRFRPRTEGSLTIASDLRVENF